MAAYPSSNAGMATNSKLSLDQTEGPGLTSKSTKSPMATSMQGPHTNLCASSHSSMEESSAAGSARNTVSPPSVNTAVTHTPPNNLATLADDHAPRGLAQAIVDYKGEHVPFLMKITHSSNPTARNVYLTHNGQRPSHLTQAQLIPRIWGSKYQFWSLDLNGERLIVKGWPNNGKVQGGKWAYYAWSPSLDDFEQEPIAFSTIGNDPENRYVRRKKAQATGSRNAIIDFTSVTQASIPTGYTSDTSHPSDDDYATDDSLEYTPPTHRLRRDPLPGSWLELGGDSDQPKIGSDTSEELASLSESLNSSSSSESDNEITMEMSKPQNPHFAPVDEYGKRKVKPPAPSAYYKYVGVQGDSVKKVHRNLELGTDGNNINLDANLIPARLEPNRRSVSALFSRPHMPGATQSLMFTIRDPLGRIAEITSSDPITEESNSKASTPRRSTRQRMTTIPASDPPLSQTGPRREVKPTPKIKSSPLSVPLSRKRKYSGSASKPALKKHQRQISSASPNRFEPADYDTPTHTPKPTNQPSPDPSYRVPEPKIHHLTLTAYKQTHTTIRVSLVSSKFTGLVPLKLRSCMTMDTFFSSIISTTENVDRDPPISMVGVVFEWKDDRDPKKRICVKRNVWDSFEVFLETIDEAPCWKEENGRCEVAVCVMIA